MRHSLFIADLHLGENKPKIAELFFKFLKEYASNPQVDALYILGDFFHVWVGDDDISPFTEIVKKELRALITPVYLMAGNRDFLLDGKFASQSQVLLIPDPYILNLYGKPTLLIHGDILCTKDKLQIIFRCLTKRGLCQKLFLALPLKLRKSMANFMQNLSCRCNQRKSLEKMDVVQSEVIKKLREYNCEQMIHGHIHRPNIYNFTAENINIRRIVLANWDDNLGQALKYNTDGSYEILQITN
jgi:UDP-2,3-diacylglucosamine hydrolase